MYEVFVDDVRINPLKKPQITYMFYILDCIQY